MFRWLHDGHKLDGIKTRIAVSLTWMHAYIVCLRRAHKNTYISFARRHSFTATTDTRTYPPIRISHHSSQTHFIHEDVKLKQLIVFVLIRYACVRWRWRTRSGERISATTRPRRAALASGASKNNAIILIIAYAFAHRAQLHYIATICTIASVDSVCIR